MPTFESVPLEEARRRRASPQQVRIIEEYQGYIEGSRCGWEALADMRLSNRDLDYRKSMNTMLHILEAYTNLLGVWDNAQLKAQHRALLEIFQQHILDYQTGHFKLFFDDQWQSLSEIVSFGHDIEGI